MKLLSLAAVILATGLLGACGPAGMEFRMDSQSNQTNNTNSINGGPSCTPNGGAPGGIQGSVYYISSNATPLSSVYDYFKSGTLDKNTYYWSQLDTPTTYYTAGFADVTGQPLKDNSGNILTQNYAIQLNTQIGLSSIDTAGEYEFAILSDDGAVLNIADSNGNYQTVVNNDGLHPTQFGCATQTINVTSTTELNAQILYYQGPLDYTALILMWKKIAPGSPIDTMYCGQNGNTLFFTPATTLGGTATPQAAYTALLARGWTVLNPNNFTLPGAPVCI